MLDCDWSSDVCSSDLAKMLLVDVYKIPIGLALGVVALIIAASIVASLMSTPRRRD
jgi:tellurite resistance protein TerC